MADNTIGNVGRAQTAGSKSAQGTQGTEPLKLAPEVKDGIAKAKATCPFIGTAVATEKLPVRGDAQNPTASIDDVVKLGNSGGGDLGEVLKIFATGNHAFVKGANGKLDQPALPGMFSLEFPGSQGSHPGHSGILQGDPTKLGSGRFSEADFDRLISRAKNGYVKRSDIGKFIAENMRKDPNSKVASLKVAGLLAKDVGHFVGAGGSALLDKLEKKDTGATRKTYEALTKVLGEDNLVGSAGEFGLLMAFFANKPGNQKVDGEPAISVKDLTSMFKDHQFPEGWDQWKKTRTDWVTNTTALLLDASREYVKTRPSSSWR
jgi:hypothetical protein